MKFGKSLSNQIEETLPEWRDKFLSYKELKRRLKVIDPQRGDGVDAGERPGKRLREGTGDCRCSPSEEGFTFITLLEGELEKFNTFFVEKEEEYIIRLKELQERVVNVKNSYEEMMKIRTEFVDFHGEMVLLENYSALNYTGLVKILKKYDKRTGSVTRLLFVQKLLQQPFFTTDLLYKLVKECEAMLERFFFFTSQPALQSSGRGEGVEGNAVGTSSCSNNGGGLRSGRGMKPVESMQLKSAISALRVMKEIRSRSSTVSVFSLPPLQLGGLEDPRNKVPVLEQVAE